jgi:hypothetical protein
VPSARATETKASVTGATTFVVTVTGGAAATVGAVAGGLASDAGTVDDAGATFGSDAGDSAGGVFDSEPGVAPFSALPGSVPPVPCWSPSVL